MYKSPCVSYNRGMNRHPFHTCPYLNRSPHSDRTLLTQFGFSLQEATKICIKFQSPRIIPLNLAGIVTTCLLETATIMVSCCIVMLYTMF